MRRYSLLACVLAIAALLWAAPSASAATPVESGGWVEDSPAFDVQECAGGQAEGLTFTLPAVQTFDACSNGAPRAERRYHDYAGDGKNYSTGVRQFAGTFTINSMGGDRISLKQTFNGDAGPYFMLAVDHTGRLYSVEGGTTIADGVATVGATVRVNTVHDVAAHSFRVYINGELAYTDDNAPDGEFYDKFGAYQTSSGHGDISVTWSDVHFWHK
ncbi:LamG domain-containing protein [Gandjariella thermophila]|uniref:Alginate lyase 2 domain-containing protein n=1 Tax=Gandjariella thermophila TaxID=1931992 RepID=A0A4D4JBA7_9PSEU|nr:LamG domain-containing protein [Gandjariella thermophila]GDY31669.1 hypothetical protein GTS_33020 [Gandjariella thermophila]